MELVPTRSMGAISWLLRREGLTCRSELARDPGVELRLNQVTVMGRIAVWGRERYAFISNFR